MKRFKYMALAALVAFAACDEGTDVVVTPDVTGDIAGVVTIEGAAVTGVTVALSSGATTTTGAGGAYSFSGVAAGAYTITISGFAADATFSSTSKAATIVTAGQVATVNFDGAYVRTSAILGSVAAGGKNLPGVTVSLGSSQTQTDANGNYSFSGLRAGTYTLTVSGFNASQYAFATSTQNVTVGVGESKVISFNGQLLATSTISGTLYIDGNTNGNMDTGEPAVAKAGIQVALEIAVTDTLYTLTDAAGKYSFANLAEGTYKVIVLPQAAIPGAFTQSGDPRYQAVATSGATTTVNFPFVVTTQYVRVYGMLGRDGKNVGVAPIKSWTVNLYPTDVDATAATFPLVTANSVKTDANGLATFKFLRSADYSPNAAKVDGIVFAKVAAPGATYSVSGETVIEIPWSPLDSMVMAPDTFDAVYNTATVKVHVKEIDNDTLAFWKVQTRAGKDSTSAVVVQNTNADGDLLFNIAGVLANYPDTVWFRLVNAPTQTLANGHGYDQTPTAGAGSAALGSFLRVIWDGTVGPSTVIDGGNIAVKYTDSDVKVSVHRELDDTLGFTAADNTVIGGAGVQLNLRRVTSTGTTSVSTLTALPGAAATQTFLNVSTANSYQMRGRPLTANYVVLNDTSVAFTLDGSDQIATIGSLKGSAGTSTFMVKTNNNTVDGKVKTRYGASPAKGIVVTIAPTAMNIQGTATKVDTTDATGSYDFADLREGPYTITASAGDSAYVFLRTLTTAFSPVASTIRSSLTDDNDSPTVGTRDLQGFAANMKANFEAYRTDVKFSGLVVNDRDTDLTTVDPGEALAGAIINLYKDDDGSATAGTAADSLVGTATTDANGAYSFTGLREGRYTAVWSAGSPNTDVQVMTAVSTANVATTKTTATPVFGANVAAAGNLPAWNYANPGAPSNLAPANFTFLYANTVVQGKVLRQAAGNAAVPGMTVQLQKCYLSTANTAAPNQLTNVSGPRPDDGVNTTCTSFFAGVTTTVTDASGNYQFLGLREGVYKVTPLPGTVVPAYANYVGVATGFAASPGINDNQPGLFLTVGSGDIETLIFHVY